MLCGTWYKRHRIGQEILHSKKEGKGDKAQGIFHKLGEVNLEIEVLGLKTRLSISKINIWL